MSRGCSPSCGAGTSGCGRGRRALALLSPMCLSELYRVNRLRRPTGALVTISGQGKGAGESPPLVAFPTFVDHALLRCGASTGALAVPGSSRGNRPACLASARRELPFPGRTRSKLPGETGVVRHHRRHRRNHHRHRWNIHRRHRWSIHRRRNHHHRRNCTRRRRCRSSSRKTACAGTCEPDGRSGTAGALRSRARCRTPAHPR